MGAGNRVQDNAVAFTLSSALQSRMGHYELELSLEEWLVWAANNQIDSRITSFLQFRPALLSTFDPAISSQPYAAPRTWEFVNRLVKGKNLSFDDMFALSGLISEGVAIEFLTFVEVYHKLPSITDIAASPETARLPDEASLRFATADLLSQSMDASNSKALTTYLLRLPAEIQIVTLQMLRRINSDFMKLEGVSEIFVKNAYKM